MSKIFNDDWMIANGFLADAKRARRSATCCAPRRRCRRCSRCSRRHREDRARLASPIRDLAAPRDAGTGTGRQRQRRRRHAQRLRSCGHSASTGQRSDGPALSGTRTVRRDRACVQAVDAGQSGDRRHRRRRTDRRADAPRHHQLPLHQLRRRSSFDQDDIQTLAEPTKAIHVGQEADPTTGATIVPIYQTSTYTQARSASTRASTIAARSTHASGAREAVGFARGAHTASAFSSGMAATAAVINLLSAGDHASWATISTAARTASSRACSRVTASTFTYVDMSDLAAVRPPCDRIPSSSGSKRPRNPLLNCRHRGHRRVAPPEGQIVAVDNTFATPYFQQPLALGADDRRPFDDQVYRRPQRRRRRRGDHERRRAIADVIKFHQNAAGGFPDRTMPGSRCAARRRLRCACASTRATPKPSPSSSKRTTTSRVYYPGLLVAPAARPGQAADERLWRHGFIHA
jgi:hypothetical protein